MSKYIDRDAVRRAIQEYCFSPYEVTPDGIAKVVMNVPPADVVEVRHGDWEEHTYGELKCSVCGIVQEDYPHRYNYCPVCGAKMDGERREECLSK